MNLHESERAAWMVAFIHARGETLKRGNTYGRQLDRDAADEADRLVGIMRERCTEKSE